MDTSTRHFSLFLSVALSLSVGCGPSLDMGGDAPSPDEANASFSEIDGKADDAVIRCEESALLGWLNGEGVDLDALKSAGVHTRAAKGIVAHMHGADEAKGTEDDEVIESMDELDAILYVGPVALTQLAAAASDAGACTSGVFYDVLFSPQVREESHLERAATYIDEAEFSVDVAMYSFRDSMVQDSLERAVERGVQVRVIFESANSDRSDPEGTTSAKLEEMGIDVRYVNKIMHHKFALIDGPRDFVSRASSARLITGSANWSYSAATRYDENTLMVGGSPELAMRFQREFNLLWDNSRDFVWGEPKELVSSTLEITEEMIPDDPDAGAVFTSANFETYVSSRYGAGFRRVRGRDEVADFIIAQIMSAQTSIEIASGHLRSRPISEALIAKHQQDPGVDIRVYLDGQEFVSEWWTGEQQRDLDVCLQEAGESEPAREDCLDKGFYFGLALHKEGIAVRYKYYSYRWHYRTAEQMHHKYIIIDAETVLQGSYNLSDNAEHNTMENMVILTGSDASHVVEAYQSNFDDLWRTSWGGDPEQEGVQGRLSDLIEEIESATDEIPIVFDPMSLDWDQIDALKSLIAQRCPAIHSDDLRRNPERHYTCPL